MKYYVTFSCGHDGTVNVIGPHKDRDWKIKKLSERLCPECYAKQKEEEKARKQKDAEEKAKDWGLPQLEGSEKQIAWANSLRNEFVEKISRIAKEFEENHQANKGTPSKKAKRYLDTMDYIVSKELSATYWINNRFRYPEDVVDELKGQYKEGFGTITGENEVLSEATIEPQEVKHSDVIEILQEGDKIVAKCDKNNVAKNIFKEVKLSWNGQWERNITEFNGPIEDRMAELGNKLLNAGFRICIFDENIRNKAINANYECECTRWIKKITDTTKLIIKWNGYSNKLYNSSKNLPGAKWDNGMLVDVSHYEELEDFAHQYGFKFSNAALKLIDQYKEEISNVSKVEVANSKKKVDKDGLKEILESSDEILEDLREDD